MNWFKVLVVGVVAAALAGCNNGVVTGGGGQVGRISVNPSKVEVNANQSKALTATVRDAAGNTVASAEVTWEVADTGVAKVTAKGKLAAILTGLKFGQTEVYAVVDGVQSSPVSVVVSGNEPAPGQNPSEANISGQLFAVTGSDLRGTHLEVCNVTTKACSSGQYTGTAKQIPYSVKVPSGMYAVFGWRDLNNNDTVDAGDHLGCVPTADGTKCDTFNVNGAVNGKDIHLLVLGGGNGVQPLHLGPLDALGFGFSLTPSFELFGQK